MSWLSLAANSVSPVRHCRSDMLSRLLPETFKIFRVPYKEGKITITVHINMRLFSVQQALVLCVDQIATFLPQANIVEPHVIQLDS